MPKQVDLKVEHKPDGTATVKFAAFALALMATRETRGGCEVRQEADWTSAQSDEEANDEGMDIARQKWPPSEGWQHQAAIRRVNLIMDLKKK